MARFIIFDKLFVAIGDIMQQRPMVMNIGNITGATERAKARVNDLISLAEDVKNDTKKKERLEKHECKACFYFSRIGGAAITKRPCMSCGNEMIYGSTNTDVLCIECARNHVLCKHCGGDLEMINRRKKWTNQQKD